MSQATGVTLKGSPCRAVFLDRDGTLLRAYVRDGVSVPPSTEAEVELLPGVAEATARLRDLGYALVLVTNQPDVARGTASRAFVERVNGWLQATLQLDLVMCCYHDDAADCACRKPKPGLLVDAAAQLHLHLPASFMVGDRWRDVDAGRQAGCTTILLTAHAPETRRSQPHFQAATLGDAAAIIAQHLEAQQ